jgi:alcohol dehydrogenase
MLGSEADPQVPMSAVITNELEILGSHGMQALAYSRMLRMIASGTLRPPVVAQQSSHADSGSGTVAEDE